MIMNSRRDDTEAGTGRSGPSRRTLVTIAVVALAGAALYAAAGFWLAPRVLERELRAMAREEAHLGLTVETVAVNPFTLALSLHNVTLFRDESTPLATVGTVAGRIAGLGPAERSVSLREVVVRSVEVADRRGRPILEVPGATAERLVIGPDAGPVAISAPRLERPNLSLRPDRDGALKPPGPLAFVLGLPPAGGGSEQTVEIAGGSVAIGDDAPGAHVVRLGNIDGSIGRREAGDEAIASASLQSRTPGVGMAGLTAEWSLLRPRDRLRIDLTLGGFDLSVISPWLASMLGRPPRSGRADVDMLLEMEDSVLRVDSEMTIADLRLVPGTDGNPGVVPEADIDTAIALLEDANGRIILDAPVVRRRLAGRADVARLIASSVTDHLAALARSPFEYLGDLVGWSGTDLEWVGFEAGSAEIGDEAAVKLDALERALALRPMLALTVFPALDENADREALARQQVRLHVDLASSAGIPGRPPPESLDYDDPVVRDVLEEFAADRLPAPRRAALTGRHPNGDVSYYRAVFEALVDGEVVAMPALIRLARYRAQAVAEKLAVEESRDDRIRQAEEIVLAAPGRGPQVALEARASRDRSAATRRNSKTASPAPGYAASSSAPARFQAARSARPDQ